MPLPRLYSFRRCPYAIRARMAIASSQQPIEIQEIQLKNKPQILLEISPKGTVPVLQLPSGQIIDESLEIMYWALSMNDPEQWLIPSIKEQTLELITENDQFFKPYLDRYKYANRYPELSFTEHQQRACQFPLQLNARLTQHSHLLGDRQSLVDVALFPFIRQFAFVDKNWFDQQDWGALKSWLERMLNSSIFRQVMKK